MKKKLIYSFIAIAILVGFYKYKQYSTTRLSTPQMETKESIRSYAKENGIYGEILVAKDKKSYETLTKYFDYAEIYVLNNKLDLIDCNQISNGGRCYQDIQDDICKNIEIPKRKFKNINGKLVMDILLSNSMNITRSDSINFKSYDLIYIYPWVKYAESSVSENSLKWINHLAKLNDPKRLILTVNTDSLINFR